MNPMAIIQAIPPLVANVYHIVRISSMIYSEPEALLAPQHSLKDKLGAK